MADIVAIPNTIREKLGDEGSNDLVDFLNIFMEQKQQEIKKEEFHEREKLELRFEKGTNESESKISKKMDAIHSKLNAKIENVHSELKLEIENVRSELKVDIENVRSELKVDIENVRSELKVDFAKAKAEIIKWMFIFWTGTVITILGGLFGFLKLFLGK